MVSFNYDLKEINTKIVYYGPGLSGKTTNLQFIHSQLPADRREKLISLATKTDRTLFFDFLPLKLGDIGGYKTRFHLYTVPGQVFYNSTRKVVLTGVDAIVFVADSQEKRMEANLQSFENLEDNLREKNMTIEDIPFVLQYNKRDLSNLASIDKLNEILNERNVPYYESVAITGAGVFATLKGITDLMLDYYTNKGAFAKLGVRARRKITRKVKKGKATEEKEKSKWGLDFGVDKKTIPSVEESQKKTDLTPEVPSKTEKKSQIQEKVVEKEKPELEDVGLPGMEITSESPKKSSPDFSTDFDLPSPSELESPSVSDFELPGMGEEESEPSPPTIKQKTEASVEFKGGKGIIRKKVNIPIEIPINKLPEEFILDISLSIKFKK